MNFLFAAITLKLAYLLLLFNLREYNLLNFIVRGA